jgi:hypothetical protein
MPRLTVLISGAGAGLIAVVFLAVAAHLLHDSNASSRVALVTRMSNAVSNGNVNLEAITRQGDSVKAIQLRQPSSQDEVTIRRLVQEGKKNIGDSEFPSYQLVRISVKDGQGNAFCAVPVEQRVLTELVSNTPANTQKVRSEEAIADIAGICSIKPEDIKVRYFDNKFSFRVGNPAVTLG